MTVLTLLPTLVVLAPSNLAGPPAIWLPMQGSPNAAVKRHQKVSETEGGFSGSLDPQDHFGVAMAPLGDLDADNVMDLAAGAPGDSDGGFQRGALWILFLNPDGAVKVHSKISDTEGGFTGTLDNSDAFGGSVTVLGDLDDDCVLDLAVGAAGDDDGGGARGSVWILFLNSDGTVKAHQKISDTQGGFTGTLDDGDSFGDSVAALGDLDGDGVEDLAVGALHDDDGGTDRGAVWILFLNADGTVKSHQKISDTQGGFMGTLNDYHQLGLSVGKLEDLDGDGVNDLAAGGAYDDLKGVVWILFLNANGTVKGHQEIGDALGGFTGLLDCEDLFGTSVCSLGDRDGDGVTDMAVGAIWDDDGGMARGAVWILTLNGDGTVKSNQKISDTRGNFEGVLDDGDLFGVSLASLGDLDGDGVSDLAVGAAKDDDGGLEQGAVWNLFLGRVKARHMPTLPGYAGAVAVPLKADSHSKIAFLLDPPADLASTGAIPCVCLGEAVSTRNGVPSLERGSVFAILLGAPWFGGANPGRVEMTIPDSVELLGQRVYAQGFFLDRSRQPPWRVISALMTPVE